MKKKEVRINRIKRKKRDKRSIGNKKVQRVEQWFF